MLRRLVLVTFMAVSCGQPSWGTPAVDPQPTVTVPSLDHRESPPTPTSPAGRRAPVASAPDAATTSPGGAGAGPALEPARLTPDEQHEVRAALREGREHARSDRHRQAVAAFERALAILPTDMRTRCELGWSAFNAGDQDRAGREYDAAIARWEKAPPVDRRDRSSFAACLYNRGRLAEKRGDRATAVDAYARSLALRPNRTVREALDALGSPSIPAATWPWADERQVVAASLDGVRRAVGRAQCADAHDEAIDQHPCEPEARVARRITIGGDLAEAAVIEIETSTLSMGNWITAWIAMRRASDWVAIGPVAESNASGAGGTVADMRTLGLRAESIVPGGASEIVAEITTSFHDFDLGVNLLTSSEERLVVPCGLEGAAPTCWGRIVTESRYAEGWATPLDQLAEEERSAMDIDPSFRPSDETKRLAVTLGEDGFLTIAGRVGALRPGVAGRHELRSLPMVLQGPFSRAE